jgi:hypothetical protein
VAKHIQGGWSTSSDEIPEPISIVTGQNLRQNSEKYSKASKEKKARAGKASSALSKENGS